VHSKANSVDGAMGRLRELLPEKRRKDAVLCVEYVMTASPDWWRAASQDQQQDFFAKSIQWINDKYGANRVIVCTEHHDESTPHLSVFVVPLTQDGRLSAKEFVGSRGKLSADQTEFAKRVAHLGLERGLEGSKARHRRISTWYAGANGAAPQIPSVELPEPSMADRIKPKEYGKRVADQVLRKLVPQVNSGNAKALKLDDTERRLESVEKLARRETKRANEAEHRALIAEEIVRLFTPEQIDFARNAKAEQQRQFEEVEAKQQAELEARLHRRKIAAEKQRRIEALPQLVRKVSGAAATFVQHALDALRLVNDDASRVEWVKVEGSAGREAMRDNGQEPKEVISAICDLSPIRADQNTHAKVYEWCERVGPELTEQYKQRRAKRDAGYDFQ